MARKFSTSIFSLVGGDGEGGGGFGTFLPLAGGTMTGAIELAGNAVNPLEPITFNQFQLGLVGLTPKGSVEAASTADEDIANPATDTFDGHTLNNGDKLLLQFQTNPIENGIYVFNGIGVAMVRSSVMAAASDAFGAYVSVVNGTTYGATFRICISDPGIVGTDGLVWDFQTTNLLAADGTTIVNNTNILSIANGGITDIHVNAAAAIAGTKISPAFGSQAVSTNLSVTGQQYIIAPANNGFLQMRNQTFEPGALSGNIRAYSSSAGHFSIVNSAGNSYSLNSSGLGGDVTYVVPASSGTLALVPSPGFVTSTGTTLTAVPSINLSVDVSGLLDVSFGGTGTNAYTAGSVIFANASQLTEDNANFFWDDANNYLGLRTSANPTCALQIGVADATKYAQMAPGAGLIVTGSGANTTRIVAESTFGSSIPAEISASARPSAEMGAFEELGWYSFMGRDDAGDQRRGAYLRGITSGAWTAGSLPTHIDFFTTAASSASPTQRARLYSSGELYIGSTGLIGSTGTLNVGPLSSSKIGIYSRAQSGQTADMLQIQNNSAVTVMSVDADGDLLAKSISVNGTAGAGFIDLVAQTPRPATTGTSLRIYSDLANQLSFVNTANHSVTLDTSALSVDRTYTFQNDSHIIANVPGGVGFVKSSGGDLFSVPAIELATDVDGTLPIFNGGTGASSLASGIITSNGVVLSSITFPSAGVVTSNGSAFSSYSRQTLRVTATQSVASTTPTTLTELTSASLAAGNYRFSGVLVFQSTATTTGVGFRMNVGTASVSSCYAKWRVAQAANGTAKDYVYDQLSTAVNVVSASAIAANTDAIAIVEGTFTVSSPGTMAIQLRSETGTSVSIRANSFIEIVAI
jgi:hypothetical protein